MNKNQGEPCYYNELIMLNKFYSSIFHNLGFLRRKRKLPKYTSKFCLLFELNVMLSVKQLLLVESMPSHGMTYPFFF